MATGTVKWFNDAKGFGFIEYSNTDDARAAITGLDGRAIDGQALKVSEAKPRKGDVNTSKY